MTVKPRIKLLCDKNHKFIERIYRSSLPFCFREFQIFLPVYAFGGLKVTSAYYFANITICSKYLPSLFFC